jgi:hypothetical protein
MEPVFSHLGFHFSMDVPADSRTELPYFERSEPSAKTLSWRGFGERECFSAITAVEAIFSAFPANNSRDRQKEAPEARRWRGDAV